MLSIQNDIMLVKYTGKVERNKSSSLINTILHYKNTNPDRVLLGVLISLKEAKIEDENLAEFVQILNQNIKKIALPVGLIDYDTLEYKKLRSLSEETSIKLLKNANVARVFLSPKMVQKDMKILVYDENEQNLDALARELSQFGYTVFRAENAKDLQDKISKQKFDIVISHSSLNQNKPSHASSSLSLSKKLIVNLPIFMDTAVNTLVSFTGLEAKKLFFGVKAFDMGLKGSVITSVMKFDGDINGNFVLVFPKEIAVKSLQSMLGEDIDENDLDALKDGVGEFCNMITGSAKVLLSKKDIKVLFELPKTYTSLNTTLASIGKENGVWIDMQLDSKPFYMFVTK